MHKAVKVIVLLVLAGSTGVVTGSFIYRNAFTHPPAILQVLSGTFTSVTEPDQIHLIQPDPNDLSKNYLVIYRGLLSDRRLIWRSPAAPVWKIMLSDVDGDGRNELALCLYKAERHDPKKDNRLQIYAWGENGIYAKWRGTFLCYPFKQAMLEDVDLDGRVELISLESYTQRHFLSVYRWNGFGFDLLTQEQLEDCADTLACVQGALGTNLRLSSRTGVWNYRLIKNKLQEREG